MDYHWYDAVGNMGVLIILLAYLLLQLGKLHSTMIRFSLFNLVGAFFILISLCYEFNLSAFLIEFFWLIISMIGIVKSLKNAPATRASGDVAHDA